jgi:hypothetical protein
MTPIGVTRLAGLRTIHTTVTVGYRQFEGTVSGPGGGFRGHRSRQKSEAKGKTSGLQNRREPKALETLPDFGHAPLNGEFLELQDIMARDDTVGRTGEFSHMFLIFEIRGIVRFVNVSLGLCSARLGYR